MRNLICKIAISSICSFFFKINSSAQTYPLIGGNIYVSSNNTAGGPVGTNTYSPYFCYSVPNKIISGYNVIGYGVPPYIFTWQKRNSSTTTWTDIPATNTLSYTIPVNDSANLIYRRKVQDSTNDIKYSNEVSVNYCSFYPGYARWNSSSVSNYYVSLPVGFPCPLVDKTWPGYSNNNYSASVNYDLYKKTPSSTLFNYIYYLNNGDATFTPSTEYVVGDYYYRRYIHSYDCTTCTMDSNTATQTLRVTYTNNASFNPGTIVPNNYYVLLGDSIGFSASTPAIPSSMVGSSFTYFWEDSIPGGTKWNDIFYNNYNSSIGYNFTTRQQFYVDILSQPRYFRRRAWSSENYIAYTSNVYLRTVNNVANYVTLNNQNYNMGNITGNRWYNFVDSSGIFMSINPGTVNLGTVTLSHRHFGMGTSNIPVAPNLIAYMPRYMQIASSNYTTASTLPANVKIRLYFKNSELADFKTRINDALLTVANLSVSRYTGPNQDCDITNNIAGNSSELLPINANFPTGVTNHGFYLEINTNRLGEFGVASANTPLPVTWMNFTGNLKDKAVQLNWNVANQSNNKGFEVQRSSNGSSFQNIGFVNATTATTYNFIDAAPLANTNFYRLRQVDNDGKAIYSNTITIRANSKNKFTVFPNPITDGFTVQAATIENIKYNIVNASGQIVSTGITTNNKKIDVSALPKGTYALQLFTESDKQVFKIVRQ
jgi:Secretion system C-terminal sorting domain